MRLDCIKLENFRNYKNEEICFSSGINVLCGKNAQGKTNVLEAITALSTMRLFRTSQKKECIKFNENNTNIKGEFETQCNKFTLQIKISKQKPTEVFKNNVKIKRQNDIKGLIKTVLFCPDDLYLVRAGASQRRKFIDMALCQLRPNYDKVLSEYERVLAHKNKILKYSEKKPEMLNLLDDFSIRLAYLGAIIIHYRVRYIKKLAKKAYILHNLVAPCEKLEIKYKTVSTIKDKFADVKQIEKNLVEHAQSHKKAEIATKSCLSGPHKDDIEIRISGFLASSFASQGQIRTCALVLKLAEREMFFDDYGEYPVLLLDDVLSELDINRQDFVLNKINEGQVIITCCDFEILRKINAGKIFFVENGRVLTNIIDNK